MRGPQNAANTRRKIDTRFSTANARSIPPPPRSPLPRSSAVSGRVVEGVEARWAGRVGRGRCSTARASDGGGEAVGDVGDQVAFGVDDHDPAAGVDVGEDQLGEQGGFPGAGGADDVQVVAGVRDATRPGAPTGPPGHRVVPRGHCRRGSVVSVVVSPRGFTSGPGVGMPGGGRDGAGAGADRARGRARRWGGRRSRRARRPTAGHRARNRRAAMARSGRRRWSASVVVVPGEGGEHRGHACARGPGPARRAAAARACRVAPARRVGCGVGRGGGWWRRSGSGSRRWRRGPWRPRPGRRWSSPAGSADPRPGRLVAVRGRGRGVGGGQRPGVIRVRISRTAPDRDRADGAEQAARRVGWRGRGWRRQRVRRRGRARTCTITPHLAGRCRRRESVVRPGRGGGAEVAGRRRAARRSGRRGRRRPMGSPPRAGQAQHAAGRVHRAASRRGRRRRVVAAVGWRGVVWVVAPGQAAVMARSTRPGGIGPGTQIRIVDPSGGDHVLEAQVGLAEQQPPPARAQQPGQVAPQRRRPVGVDAAVGPAR